MALDVDILADELADALDAITEGAAAPAAFAAAYSAYFADATLNGVPIAGSVLTAARAAMAGALSFPSSGTASSAAASFVAGVTAWWGSLAGVAATCWTGCTTITPPAAIGSLGAGLISTFATNMTVASRAIAAANLAARFHTASLGGSGVIPPTTFPIL